MTTRFPTTIRRIAALCIGAIAIAGCTTHGTPQARSPSADALIDAVLADYQRSQAALIAASRKGASATVTMLVEDGQVHSGRDVFYSEPSPRILEIRDNMTSMQVGSTACSKGPDDDRFHCRETEPLHLGLFEVSWERVVKAWSEDLACTAAQVPCRFLKVRLLPYGQDKRISTTDADLVGRDYEVLITLSDHRPVYVRQVNRDALSAGGMALFVFDFDHPVEMFELPDEASIED